MKKLTCYERLTALPLDAIIDRIGMSPDRPIIEVMGHELKAYSLRLRTFASKGTACTGCDMQAEFFAVERHKNGNTEKYHLNLYGRNTKGQEVLFTHDHVIALAKGGANDLSNTQTMCIVCNARKGCK